MPAYSKAFIQKVALPAKKLRPLCEIRETAIASVIDRTLFDALIDGMNKSRNVSLWMLAREVWDSMTALDGNINIDEEKETSEAIESQSVKLDEELNKNLVNEPKE